MEQALSAPAVKPPRQATWARGLLAVAIIIAVWLRAHTGLDGAGHGGLLALPLAWVLAGLLVGWMLGDPIESAGSLWTLSLLPMLTLSLAIWPDSTAGEPARESLARLSTVALLAHLAAHLHLWCALQGERPGWNEWAREARAAAVLVGLLAFGSLAIESRWLPALEVSGVGLAGLLLVQALRAGREAPASMALMQSGSGPGLLGRALAERLRGFGLVWQVAASLALATAAGQAQGIAVPVLLAFWSGSAALCALLGMHLFERRRQRSGQLQRAGRDALEAARRYRHVYYSAPVGLMSASPEGFLLRWNDQAGRLFKERLVHGRINSLSAVFGFEGSERLARALASQTEYRTELRAVDGRVLDCEAVLVDGSIELSFVDVTERSRLAGAYEHMAFHDSLTDLLNRRGLERHAAAALSAQADGRPVSLLWLDLDRFKSINEVFGHAAGDAVIVEVARRLKASCAGEATITVGSAGGAAPVAAAAAGAEVASTEAARTDAASTLVASTEGAGHGAPGSADAAPLVGRVGGDEFFALLPGRALAAARLHAGRLLAQVTGEAFRFEGTGFEVAASIGVVEATPGMSVGELMAQADHACRLAKQAGPGHIRGLPASERSLDEYRAIVRWGGALHSSLALDRLRLHAQPIVPLQDPTALPGLEVLLRTVDEHGVLEGPARLLAVAERQGSMVAIDRHVLQETIAFCTAHPALLAGLAFITVNLSGLSLNDARFLAEVQVLLSAHPGVAHKLHLEITEAVAVRDIRSTRRFVERMREIGVGVALDDFGAGYTSFAYLRDIPAEFLKIDGQFVVGLGRDPRQRAIISAIQQLGRQLGMRTVAEWVEEDATLETLVALGVDYGQGHLFATAEPLEAWTGRPLHFAVPSGAQA